MANNTIRTFDLDAGCYGPSYVGITPRQAVIAAHAQALGDFNTWDYEREWGHLVTEGERTVRCGSFTTGKYAGLSPEEAESLRLAPSS